MVDQMRKTVGPCGGIANLGSLEKENLWLVHMNSTRKKIGDGLRVHGNGGGRPQF